MSQSFNSIELLLKNFFRKSLKYIYIYYKYIHSLQKHQRNLKIPQCMYLHNMLT